MPDSRWTSVDQYLTDLLVKPDAALDAALAASAAAGLPAISVSAPQGKQLMLLARLMRARRILEIGTLGGYSTIWMARGLPPDGKLVTLEIDPRHAEVARANIAGAGLADRVEIRIGPAGDLLPALIAERAEPFDMVFIDADKASIPEYFARALELTHGGSAIIVDNVIRDGAVIDPNGDASVQGVRRFNEMVAAEPAVTATAIQTVGVKGYDGYAVVLVN